MFRKGTPDLVAWAMPPARGLPSPTTSFLYLTTPIPSLSNRRCLISKIFGTHLLLSKYNSSPSTVARSKNLPCIRSVHGSSAMQAQLPSRPRPFVAPKPQSSRQTRIQLPTSSWDSHMHVISPEYPLAASAQYTPKPHLLSEATAFENSLGLSNIVLVQPSIYGTDNSCLLDALRHLGPERARGVVVFDPARIEKRTLDKWHKLGVRGVRVNLVSVGQELDDFQLAKILRAHADIIRPYNWVLNLHVPLTSATALEKIIPSLGVRVCLDHFCQPRLPSLQLQRQHPYTISRDPYKLPGFSALINLLILGNTYVKLSAPYRISKEEGQGDLDPIGRELLRVADRRCVWASDWPHTRYEDIEAAGFVKSVIGWCEETGGEALERVFRRNAEELWDVKS